MDFAKIKTQRHQTHDSKLRRKRRFRLIAGLVFVASGFFVLGLASPKQKGYLVVIDPGHGGAGIAPKQVHGDKYDPVRKEYLIYYQQGTSYRGEHESEIVHNLAKQVAHYLELTHTDEGRQEFHKLLQEFAPNAPFPEEPVRVVLSKPEGLIGKGKKNEFEKPVDYNAPYREYDFPLMKDGKKTGQRAPGVISRINEQNPHLVVSLHINSGYGSKTGAMTAVAAPGYNTYRQALQYVRADKETRRKIANDFDKSPYRYWFSPNSSRTTFQWFLCDSWVYFTGYWSTTNGLTPDPKKYQGQRYNYFTWAYEDDIWDNPPLPGRQLPDLASFQPAGPFWEREQSEPERWRREGGEEGLGGDNLYAGNELLRYIRQGLVKDKVDTKSSLPVLRRPTLSPWTMPTHINAISAYLELGFLDNPNDYRRLTQHPDTYARSLAAGIYSLLYGLPLENAPGSDKAISPKGKPVDFKKYENHSGGNYFQNVTQ